MAYTTIDDPSKHFQTIIWTGDGNDDRDLTFDGNSDMQPDLIWNKRRPTTGSHMMHDTSRGITNKIMPNDTAAESAESNAVQSVASDGFQVGSDGNINYNTRTYVAWCWKCNGGTEENAVTESGNNPGNNRQTNTTAGFSIIKYVGTGAAGTIAHGLGATPQFIIHKSRDGGTENWPCYHIGTGNTHACDLNRDNAKIDNDSLFNDTSPTSSVFTVNSDSAINEDGDNCIAYAWTPIQGYSKFGSYTGNGNTDGTFVYTGFKPSFLLLKKTSATADWQIRDNKRDSFNDDTSQILFADLTDAEASSTNNIADFLSNGFKLRGTGADHNQDNATFIYIAFAEHPFVSSKGVPTTAR
jgi:hypothetical protein